MFDKKSLKKDQNVMNLSHKPTQKIHECNKNLDMAISVQ